MNVRCSRLGVGRGMAFLRGLSSSPARRPRASRSAATSATASASTPVRTKPTPVVCSPPRAVYVHVPFCRQRCYYCDFPVVVTADSVPRSKRHDVHAAYFEALRREITSSVERRRSHQRYANGGAAGQTAHPLESVYFGGGTPSLASPAAIGGVLSQLDQVVGLATDCEVTLEMDPGSFDLTKACMMREVGVNRVSVGAQTFHAPSLQACGRAHSVADTYRAIEHLQAAGLHNYSLDLIGGLPNLTLELFKESITAAISMNPAHVSCYDLIVEPGTRFARQYAPGVSPLPSEGDTAEMYCAASRELTAAGFRHYETSNFAKPGHESVHNRVYWRNEPYYGIGMGAASFVDARRVHRPKRMHGYLAWLRRLEAGEPSCDDAEVYTFETEVEETVMLMLRTADGVSWTALCERFGEKLARCVFDALAKQDAELVQVVPRQFARLTAPQGFVLQNAIIVDVLASLPF